MIDLDLRLKKLRRIRPLKWKARRLYDKAQAELDSLRSLEASGSDSSVLISGYFHLVSRLIGGLMAADGYSGARIQTRLAYLESSYPDFGDQQFRTIEQLLNQYKIMRARGRVIDPRFFEKNGEAIKQVVDQLFKILDGKLKT